MNSQQMRSKRHSPPLEKSNFHTTINAEVAAPFEAPFPAAPASKSNIGHLLILLLFRRSPMPDLPNRNIP
jgi:hypothetical protein